MRILILGANGMIGHKMYLVLSNKFEDTWSLLRQSLHLLPHQNLFKVQKTVQGVDLADFEKLITLLNQLNPDVIINAAGITIRRGINDIVSHSVIINSALPHLLEEWVLKNNKRLIHFSTDCVFSGKAGAYSEESIPDAIDNYGRTKALGEVMGSGSLTLRGSMIGRELANFTELLEWFLSQKGKTINGFQNVIYSGITTVRMAEFVSCIISDFPNMTGLYNVSSIPVSKYDLLTLFNKNFKMGIAINGKEDYHSRKDLKPDRFYNETGFTIPVWEDLAEELKRDSDFYFKYYKQY